MVPMMLTQQKQSRCTACLLAVAVCLLFIFCTPVSAEEERTYHDVLYGTPVLDGAIDELYTYSYHAPIAASLINIQPWGEGGENTVFRTDAYVLWDEDYLYFAAKVYDDTLTYFPFDAAFSEREGYAEHADMFICCFLDEFSNDYFKVGVDAFGMYLSAQSRAYDAIDISSAVYATTCDPQNGYYIVEMALPFYETLTEGFEIGWHFMVANAATDNANGCYSCGPLGGCYSNSIRLVGDRAADLLPVPSLPEPFSLSDIPDIVYAVAVGILFCAAGTTVAWISRRRCKKDPRGTEPPSFS